MGARAEALAKQFEAKAAEMTAAIEKLSDADWKKVTSAEKWSVGVTAHHVAVSHEPIAGIVKAVASGQSMPPFTMAMLDEMNAQHAREHASCTRAETLAAHKAGAAAAAALVRALTDGQVDARGVIMTGMPAMSVQQIIEGVLINHVAEHLGSIRSTVGACRRPRPVITDRYGLELSTCSPAAARAYVEAVDLILAAGDGADTRLDQALAADPGFALAHAARARSLTVQGRAGEAREAAALAEALVGGASRREREHARAIALAVSGDLPGALEATRAHVADFPRDALVLSLATGIYSLIGFSGRADRNELALALLDGLAPAYGEDWWFLAVHAFAHTEAGRPRDGERLVRRSLDLHPRNAHGAHTLAHALYEQGEDEGGASWVSRWLQDYERAGALHCHLSWHVALFELRRGRADRARALYADAIRPGASLSPPLGGVADAAAFLWRYGLAREGIAGLPWREVADHATRRFPRAGNAFVDLHCALAFAAAGDAEALDRRLAELRDMEAADRQPAGPVVVALVQAVSAFAREDWARAIALIEPLTDQVVRVGGSRAQRDLVEDTLLQAYVRAGRPEAAASLLRSRLERRPCLADTTRLAALDRRLGVS